MLLSPTSIFVAYLITAVTAVPFERRWFGHGGRPWWTGSSPSSSYLEFGKRFTGPNSNAPICDLSSVSLPQAPTPLPAPSSGLSLSHVAIGRGTQNYTCDLSNATAVPVAVGAVASLFNVSCLAAASPALVEKLPGIALDLPIPTSDDTNSPAYQDMSGHHYFLDATTPYFNLDTTLHSYGNGAFKKSNSSAAPADAPLGPYGSGNGSVAWLKLDAKTTGGQVFQEVYRLYTAGGQPSKTCTGMPAAFEVQYAAAYYLFT